MKILFVDDDPTQLLIYKRAFTQFGHDIRCALTGKQALKIFDDFYPDVVVSDGIMPEMDGIELAKILYKKGVSIIMVTGNVDKVIDAQDHNCIKLSLLKPASLTSINNAVTQYKRTHATGYLS